jgi:hypothetical protein
MIVKLQKHMLNITERMTAGRNSTGIIKRLIVKGYLN